MKKRFLPALLALLMLATVAPTFTACSDDDDDKNNSEQTESQKLQYDDLDIFQRAICNIDSAGQLVRYEIGQALHDAEPQHLYIGVDDIEEAAKMFRTWIAPDVKLPAGNADLTAELTDTLGHAQGTIYFRAGSGQTVAEVTYSPETKLKYIDKITFLLNSAWPYNSGEKVWHLGDIRSFRITGNCGEGLADNDKSLNFVLIQEGGNGLYAVWAAITNNKYTNSSGKQKWGAENSFDKVFYSDYCPIRSSADYITIMLKENWNYFVERFNQAGCGPLDASASYWINSTHWDWGRYYECMAYSSGYVSGITQGNGEERFLLKIDWLRDGELPLTSIGGSEGFPGEGYANLFDCNGSTKWLTINPRTKSEVSGKDCWWAEFQTGSPINPYSYKLQTGNDTGTYPERNPKSGALYGKKNARSQWTLIDSRTNFELPAGNYVWKEYQMNGTRGDYQYFRFEVYEQVSGGSVQLSELQLCY
jgi:hypothetical protein